MKIKFRIKRCDPMSRETCEPFVQGYDVEVTEGMTILDALLKIADEQDPSLSFRKSCRSAICGSCAMTINGFSRLACATQVMPEVKKFGEMEIEPLPNHTVLKDLVVDMNPFWEKLEKITPYLTPKEGAEKVCVLPEDLEAIGKSQQCIMCGCCNGECNALEIDKRYIAPAALAKAWRFVGDVREGNARRRLDKLSDEHGMWDCVRCVHCTQYCPKGVAPLKAIELLRSAAMKEGITDNHGAKHAVAMAESVKRVGRLDEAAMTFKTLGFLKSLGMIPFGLKMELHGKMPLPLVFAQINDIAEVRAIYEACERKKGKG
ncbi:MAG: succinate dehydrogenase/fumarate reductase iron-sulfur subunit [Deltaproteobacteria bacterium]|nr:succinate dehydrogenase/fumarate reductase iron-sulfur subunit [Deltaproteobacteria bacterium]